MKSPPPLPDFHGFIYGNDAFVCYSHNMKDISCVLTKPIFPDRLPASHKNKINIHKNCMNLARVSAHSPQRGKIEIWECHKTFFDLLLKQTHFYVVIHYEEPKLLLLVIFMYFIWHMAPPRLFLRRGNCFLNSSFMVQNPRTALQFLFVLLSETLPNIASFYSEDFEI